jgi:hypothetical protein
MSDVIRRRADGSWGQGDDVPTYASDHAETWTGTRDKSMDHVSDEYAKYVAAQKERNMKEGIGKLHLQKECTDLLEENGKLRKINKELIGFLEKECRMCMFGGLIGCGACLLNEECERLDVIKKAKEKDQHHRKWRKP